jgi:hypothetical protein
MVSETVYSFSYVDSHGRTREYFYETLERPTPIVEPRALNLVYEQIEIPPLQPLAPLPSPAVEFIEVPPFPQMLSLPAPPTEQQIDVKKAMDVPYFTWLHLGPRRLAIDYITNIPVSVPPSGRIQAYFSLVLENGSVEIWGTLLHVMVFAEGKRLIGELTMQKTSNRPHVSSDVSNFSSFTTWTSESRDKHFLESEGTLIHLAPKSRKIRVWDAPEVRIHDGSSIHTFSSRNVDRPFEGPRGLRETIEKQRDGNPTE